LGTLDEPEKLSAQLKQIFQERKDSLAFKPGMERRDDVPMIERVERTVLIQPSRSLTYGEVTGLISVIRKSNANPVALQVGSIEN
jgi:biopolymer transport protein ExbD